MMRENYDFYCNLMKNKADKKLRELNSDLYDGGYLEQEQETINENIESLLADYLLVWDDKLERHTDEKENADEIYTEYAEWFEDYVSELATCSVGLIVDYLEDNED